MNLTALFLRLREPWRTTPYLSKPWRTFANLKVVDLHGAVQNFIDMCANFYMLGDLHRTVTTLSNPKDTEPFRTFRQLYRNFQVLFVRFRTS